MKKQKKDKSIEALEHALKNYNIINCTATYLEKVPITVIHLQLELLEQKLHNYERNKNDIADLDNTLENKLKENLPQSTYQHRLKKMRSRQINFLHTSCNGADGAEIYMAFLKETVEEKIASPKKITLTLKQIAELEKALIGFDNVKEPISALKIELESLQKQALALKKEKSKKNNNRYYNDKKNLDALLKHLNELYNDPIGAIKYIDFLNSEITEQKTLIQTLEQEQEQEQETFTSQPLPSQEAFSLELADNLELTNALEPQPSVESAKNANIVPIETLRKQITALEQKLIGFDNIKEQITALKIELGSLQNQTLALNKAKSKKEYYHCYYNNKQNLREQLNYLRKLLNDPMGTNKYIAFLNSKIKKKNALIQTLEQKQETFTFLPPPSQYELFPELADKWELAGILEPQPSFLFSLTPKHIKAQKAFSLSNAVPVRNVCGAP